MARNSEALKDVDDRVLGNIANRMQSPNTVSKYGLPESQFSMATKEFLMANGIVERGPPDFGDIEDVSYLLNQPKL